MMAEAGRAIAARRGFEVRSLLLYVRTVFITSCVFKYKLRTSHLALLYLYTALTLRSHSAPAIVAQSAQVSAIAAADRPPRTRAMAPSASHRPPAHLQHLHSPQTLCAKSR